jgi:site-specific recombinase XerD
MRGCVNNPELTPKQPVFPSTRGEPLSRDAVERLVDKHVATAQKSSPSLKGRNITPHTLRYSAAMDLLHAGVDRSVIALWLGHESMETTQIYLHADIQLKLQAMVRTTDSRAVPPPLSTRGRRARLPRGALIMPPPTTPSRVDRKAHSA